MSIQLFFFFSVCVWSRTADRECREKLVQKSLLQSSIWQKPRSRFLFFCFYYWLFSAPQNSLPFVHKPHIGLTVTRCSAIFFVRFPPTPISDFKAESLFFPFLPCKNRIESRSDSRKKKIRIQINKQDKKKARRRETYSMASTRNKAKRNKNKREREKNHKYRWKYARVLGSIYKSSTVLTIKTPSRR